MATVERNEKFKVKTDAEVHAKHVQSNKICNIDDKYFS